MRLSGVRRQDEGALHGTVCGDTKGSTEGDFLKSEYTFRLKNAGPAGLLSQRFYTPGALTVTFGSRHSLCHLSYFSYKIRKRRFLVIAGDDDE